MRGVLRAGVSGGEGEANPCPADSASLRKCLGNSLAALFMCSLCAAILSIISGERTPLGLLGEGLVGADWEGTDSGGGGGMEVDVRGLGGGGGIEVVVLVGLKDGDDIEVGARGLGGGGGMEVVASGPGYEGGAGGCGEGRGGAAAEAA